MQFFDDFTAGAEQYEYLEEIGHGSFSEVGGEAAQITCGLDPHLSLVLLPGAPRAAP